MSNKYEIRTVADFCEIPSDRLDACLSEFADAVKFNSLLRDAATVIQPDCELLTMRAFVWTDDGNRSCEIDLIRKE